MAFASDNRTAGFSLIQTAGNLVALVSDRLEKRKQFTQTVNELSSLSNRELADLGIARSMITRVARDAAYGA